MQAGRQANGGPGDRLWLCSQTSSVQAFRVVTASKHRQVARRAADGGSVQATLETTEAPPRGPPPSAPVKQESEVRVVDIGPDTFSLRGYSQDRLKFEIEYNLKRGTTNNSYLIQAQDGTALIDVPDQAWTDAFVEQLKTKVGIDDITYLILGHFSPKRADSLVALLKERSSNAPPLKVHCSNPARNALLELDNKEPGLTEKLDIKVAKAGDQLDLGGGHQLRFFLTPTPRWPDGMMTYDAASKILYTHKLFSAHVASENDFDRGGWEAFGVDWKYYFDCMLAPVARQAAAALEKLPIAAQIKGVSYAGLRGVEIVKADAKFISQVLRSFLKLPEGEPAAAEGVIVVKALAPIHGPVVRSTVTELVREYREWTAAQIQLATEASIAVIYASAYGNTAALAQAISRGVSKAGVSIETVNCEQSSASEVAEIVSRSDGFVVGSPTLGGHMPTPVQLALGAILKDPDARAKPCGVFGSFGWSGEAVDELEQRLKDGGFDFAFPAIRCKFKPTESMLQTCEESGTDLAQAVRKANTRARKSKEKTATSLASSAVEQAVGRVVGSLCVLVSRDGDAESAMLASWVSQASFNPPGLTVAVAKDRAVEGLVLEGGRFTLNVLGQDNAGKVSKQLLKPFKPGEARLQGLETQETESGGVVLNDAIAYLDCMVKSRMETGDHYVLYAIAENGKLQNDRVLTAVHYRKTGARY
ncbi:Flavin reductase-like FMN-binding protein [Klebsormidium nitens]|uniref:Flavin reductase-like FMN-binding protein n=1 Tax=Klebsormidium nitens TaxID=105231 RepID=A0A1Y1HTQ2_KLENI|nr:Flavin reductase-like FMN-binding protein [Klebsormidium nitens]|eukprot:GAQ79906.1 Flavin reductase-like FMN-binding protein [Klebsormidium nitens]